MGLDTAISKKRKSNPSEQRVQKRDFKRTNFKKQHLGQRAEREATGEEAADPTTTERRTARAKYGATEYVRENEHFEKFSTKRRRYAGPTRSLSS